MIIVVVGMPGSGKGVFVRSAMAAGFNKIGMGDVVRHFAALSGLGSDDATVGGFATSERKAHGPAIWAERTLEMLTEGNVIIDGSRSPEEISLFRERLGAGLRIVAITAPPELRFQRLRDRHRQDDPATLEDFRRRDERELSWGSGEAIGSADVTIANEGSLEEFRAISQSVVDGMVRSHGKSI